MKFSRKEIVFFSIIFISFIASFCTEKISTERGRRVKRVHNGLNAKLGEFPYAIIIRRWYGIPCSGVLISELSALTAQHCIYERFRESKSIVVEGYVWYEIGLGRVEEGQPETTTKIKVIHLPEERIFDIAVLIFEEPVKLSEFIKPIAIATRPLVYEVGALVYHAGWGTSNDPIQRLQYQEMKILNNQGCTFYGAESTTLARVCAHNLEDGTCSGYGDSGGPLVIRRPEGDVLIGILNTQGYGCAIKSFATFASVSWNAAFIRKHGEGNLTFVEVED